MQSCLLTLHVQMLNYALERGYSYERWHTVINTILFKDPDNVKIHRTRVIHIYEADYNLTLGIKWRMALYQAEAFRELNPGQYGSRPRRNAIDPVFLEEMQLKIARASRKTLVQTNYDATSCYDRIIINLAMLVSRKYGVPKVITQTNATTLEKATYRIRTELGVADDGYTHSIDNPIYGTGQGSGNSPMIWCFLSSVLFQMYDELCHKALYCHPDRTNPMELGMIGFVDDSNGQTNCFMSNEDEMTLPTILTQLRYNAQVWANVLGTSGGSLELTKCSCHLAVWTFADKGDPVLIHTQQPAELPLNVTDPLTKASHALEFLSPYTAHKTLGHYKEPAGTQSTQYRKLWAKSDDITEFLWKCTLAPVEAWTFYYACYVPSIGYPLSCSSLTYAQCDRVQRKAMSIIIPKCGYNRHTNRAIIYGPMLYGGANFRHMYMQQGVSQITTFLRHWRQQLVPGQLLKTALAWHQLSLGVSYSFLSRVHDELPHCESVWLKSMRTFLAVINASIELDEPCIPPAQRNGDEYIMDMILDSGQFTNAQIRRLNYCRLYLQVVTLSDITDAEGEYVDPAQLQGDKAVYSSQTTWLHVHQAKPSQVEWQLWRKANLIWSYHDGELHTPLGEWLINIQQQRNQHYAYIRKQRMSQRMYLRQADGSYVICKPDLYHRQVFVESTSRISFQSIPIDSQPAAVRPSHTPQHWDNLSPQRPRRIEPRNHPTAATFTEYIDTFEPWEVDLLRHTTMASDPYTLCDTLSRGLKGGSDGSVRYHTEGSFGWMLSTNQGERVATGMGPARGPKPTSYRAEACGMLSFLRFLIRVSEYTSMVDPWKGMIVSDSESVLKTLAGGDVDPQKEPDEPVSIDGSTVVLDVLCPDWDILIEIQHALQHLPHLTIQYIKGHQDEKTPYAQLSLFAQLNCDADKLAGDYQDLHGCVRPLILMTPRTKALIHLPEGSITGKFASKLRLAYSGPRLLKAMQEKYQWSEVTTMAVNWEAHGTALGKQIKRNMHFTKMVQDIIPTNAWLNKLDKGKRICPCCPEVKEDRDHILRCPAPARDQWRQAFLKSITDYCIMEFTFPPMQTLLLDTLRHWLYSPTLVEFELQLPQYPTYLHTLIATQTRIGWRHLFNGRFCLLWSVLQDDYYYRERETLLTKKKSGLTWQTGLINLIWEKWYDLWKMRNEDVHGKDMASRAQAEKREVKRQLNEIYDMRNQMEPSARELLCADIRLHLEQPTWQIQNWLQMHGISYFRASVKTATKRAITGVPSIRQFFTVV
jgi:Reverse transcriptase (RNA-dependent DNA polymerase)